MALRLEARGTPARALIYLSPVLAVVLTVLTGAVLLALLGQDPLVALYTYFLRPLDSLYGVTELMVKAAPLVTIAVGLALGFRANVWNIGAEGQLILGAITGGGLGLLLYGWDSPFLLPAMMLAGVLGGAAWAAIPAWLRTRFNANEILTTLMLSYVAQLLLRYLINGPYRSPEGFNFPESRMFHEAATLPLLVESSRLHIGTLVALLVVAGGWVLLGRTLVGFQLRVVGQAPRAARFAGFSGNALIWFSLLLAGGLAGLAGLFEVAGPIGQIVPSISPGYGFSAIIVAFLGRLNPLGVLFAGLLLALTFLGGEMAQIEIGLPNAVTGIFQGILLFYLLASDVLILYRFRWTRSFKQREVA